MTREEGTVGGWGLSSRRGGSNHLGLHCEVKGATFEGQHGAVVVSCTLRKNPNPHLGKKEGPEATHTGLRHKMVVMLPWDF